MSRITGSQNGVQPKADSTILKPDSPFDFRISANFTYWELPRNEQERRFTNQMKSDIANISYQLFELARRQVGPVKNTSGHRPQQSTQRSAAPGVFVGPLDNGSLQLHRSHRGLSTIYETGQDQDRKGPSRAPKAFAKENDPVSWRGQSRAFP